MKILKEVYDVPVSDNDKLILELMQGDELHRIAAHVINKTLGNWRDCEKERDALKEKERKIIEWLNKVKT